MNVSSEDYLVNIDECTNLHGMSPSVDLTEKSVQIFEVFAHICSSDVNICLKYLKYLQCKFCTYLKVHLLQIDIASRKEKSKIFVPESI